MGDPVPLNRPARFVCAKHGDTNQVVGLEGQTFCLACLGTLAKTQLAPVTRKLEPVP